MTNTLRPARLRFLIEMNKKLSKFLTLLGLALISEVLRTKTNKKYSPEAPQKTYMFIHPFEMPLGVDEFVSSERGGYVNDGKYRILY